MRSNAILFLLLRLESNTGADFKLTSKVMGGYERRFLGGGKVNSQWETHDSLSTYSVLKYSVQNK